MSLRRAVVVGILALVLTTAFLPLVSSVLSTASSSKAAKAVTILSVKPDSKTASARPGGYVIYNVTVNSTADANFFELEASTDATTWTVKFLNETGVPYDDTNGDGRADIEPVVANEAYYIYARIYVPSDTPNGTQSNHTIFANTSGGPGGGYYASTTVTTTCDNFTLSGPHGIVGKVRYGDGTDADGAFALLINTATGETSYDTVGTGGASASPGNYSTDGSQMPSGLANNTLVRVTISTPTAYGTNSTTVDTSQPNTWLNVTVIRPPKVLVIKPNGGETLGIGSSYNIEWNATAGDYPLAASPITIYYSNNSGANWIQIATDEANDGVYTWSVPDDPSANCLVKVEAKDNQAPPNIGSDTSNSTFAISSVGPSPSKLRAVKEGNNINITWEDTGASYEVWRSPRLDGNFSYFSKIATVTGNLSAGTRWFVDSDAYADDNNYSYVVNATGNSTKSNIGFKLCQPLETPSGMNINMVSLPYNNQYGTLVDIPTELTNTYLS
ncbi:MAG: hypothetical protein AB1485_07660, partial [Candidatus Thermoplasmatota archaeon]